MGRYRSKLTSWHKQAKGWDEVEPKIVWHYYRPYVKQTTLLLEKNTRRGTISASQYIKSLTSSLKIKKIYIANKKKTKKIQQIHLDIQECIVSPPSEAGVSSSEFRTTTATGLCAVSTGCHQLAPLETRRHE